MQWNKNVQVLCVQCLVSPLHDFIMELFYVRSLILTPPPTELFSFPFVAVMTKSEPITTFNNMIHGPNDRHGMRPLRQFGR